LTIYHRYILTNALRDGFNLIYYYFLQTLHSRRSLTRKAVVKHSFGKFSMCFTLHMQFSRCKWYPIIEYVV
jgi:hypothetical protein